MADVGSANIKITADGKQATQEISSFSKMLKSTGKIAAGVAGGFALFETIKSSISGAVGATIGANASLEQYHNTLSVVLKSSEEATKTLNWAKEFAKQTPFEIPGIIEATTRLSAYGIRAQDVLGSVGDMASVMGTPLMQAVEAVADAQTGELERLKEFGITKQMLIDQAAKMGKAEIVNAKGQITDMQGLNDALFALMDERFKGGMEIQSRSFNGLISNASDSLGQLATTLSKPIFDQLKVGLASVVPVMGAFTSFVQGDMKGASEDLQASFGPETADKIVNVFERIGDAVDSFKQFIEDLQPTFDNLKAIGVELLPIFQLVGGAIAVVWNVISEVLPPILKLVTDIALELVKWEGFIPILIGLVTAFATFRTIINIMNLWKSAIAAVRAAQILLNITLMANPIVLIISLIVGLIAVFVTLYNTNEQFRAVVDQTWSGFKDIVAGVINWATVTVPEWWNNMVKWFTDGKNKVIEKYNEIKSKGEGIWNSIKEKTIDKAIEIWEGIKDWIGKIPGKFQETKDDILEKVRSIDLYKIGKDIVTGLINGLGDMLKSVKKKAREISDAVEGAIRDRLKMKSPSRIMIEIGYDTGTGFIIGLNDTIAEAIKKAKEFGSAITLAIRGTISNVSKIPSISKTPIVSNQSRLFSFTKNDSLFKYIDAIKDDGDWMNDWITHIPTAFRDTFRKFGKKIAPMLEGAKDFDINTFQKYLNAIIEDGDYLNDWITHLPKRMRTTVRELGKEFAKFEGFKISSPSKPIIKSASKGKLFEFSKNDALSKYIQAIIEDGDWMNDWLTHLPTNIKDTVMNFGKQIAPKLEGMKGFNLGVFSDYLNAIIEDGDFLNDWITHLPSNMRGTIRNFGKQFSRFEGLTQAQATKLTPDEHTHFWQVNADEITDVKSLIDIVNGVVQTVRSR